MKYDNKGLTKKIEVYAHDLSPYFECVLLKEEIEKLNDRNLEKDNASLVIEFIELKSLVG